MRIQAKDLSLHLKRGLANFYWVFGDDAFHRQEAIDAIRVQAKNQGYTEREVFEINAHFEWGTLLQSLQSQNLFSEKRLIECRLSEDKIGKTATDILSKLANTPLPLEQVILLITAGKIETNTQSSGWFTSLEQKGHTIQARSLTREEMKIWLSARCLREGLQLTKDAIHTLLDKTEGNCLVAAQTIEKLRLLNTRVEITPEDIFQTTINNAHFSLFDLVDALLAGSKERTIRIFSSLKNEGSDPILVLWAITREVRSIIPIARQIKAGSPEKTVFSQYGVWKRREPLVRQCVQRFSVNELHQILLKAKTIDDSLKGLAPANVWTALQRLCLELAGVIPLKVSIPYE